MKQFAIAGTGSAIADYLYDSVEFSGPAFNRFRTKNPGDGGLEPGKLVLTEDFEQFAGVDVATAVVEITGNANPTSFNLGGPAIVALINAAQLLHGRDISVRFYGANGSDETGKRLRKILAKTPVDCTNLKDYPGPSPSTIVLADPSFAGGSGERTFVNSQASSHLMSPANLDGDFYGANIRLFGGTAVVPPIHTELTPLLKRSSQGSGLTVVSTVYDFANEKANPNSHWPLGTNASYGYIDLLITDEEEARRLSGASSIDQAAEVLFSRGLRALVVTCGTEDVLLKSRHEAFGERDLNIPISKTNTTDRGAANWDTTGCGDNFCGAVLYSLAIQMIEGSSDSLDLVEACRWGVAAGDFACYYIGGTYIENIPGEKLATIERIREQYEANQ